MIEQLSNKLNKIFLLKKHYCTMKLDLHVHSNYSQDAKGTPEDLIKYAKKKGLKGIAITDHNEIKGALKACKLSNDDFIIIPGIEVSSKNRHILGLNIKEKIPINLSPKETIELIHSLGGIAIIAHPFGIRSGVNKKLIKKNDFDAIEAFNARSFLGNQKAEKLADKLKLGKTGGSDCHQTLDIGKGYTEFEIESLEIADILEEIHKRRTTVGGESMSSKKIISRSYKSLISWFGGAMKKK